MVSKKNKRAVRAPMYNVRCTVRSIVGDTVRCTVRVVQVYHGSTVSIMHKSSKGPHNHAHLCIHAGHAKIPLRCTQRSLDILGQANAH